MPDKWLEQASQWHEMYCPDLEVMSSNPGRIELVVLGNSVLSRTWSKNINIYLSYVTDAHRALELLEEYHSRLGKPQDRPLRNAIERVIRIFKSRLFQALLGEYWHYIYSFASA